MNWKSETLGDWQIRLSKWHLWFAWYPVFSLQDRQTFWLEIVHRRLVEYYSYTGTAIYEYKKD